MQIQKPFGRARAGRWAGRALAAVAVGAALLTGCARSSTTTTINPNGSWTRSVSFHGPDPSKQGLGPSSKKLEDIFELPSGAPWTINKQTKEDEIVYTAMRQLHVGDVVHKDIAFKGAGKEQNAVVMTNQAEVKETAPGVYTYREVLHWQGPTPKDMFDENALKLVKSALPANLATDANVKKTTIALERELGMILLGPPDPLLTSLFSEMMMNPELAQHRISARLYGPVDKVLTAEYGDRLTADQRRAFIKKLADDVTATSQSKVNSQSKPDAGGKDDNTSLVSLSFTVKLPGKILSSNGQTDALTNEVFWGVFPEAAAYGDIVLTATCQAPAKTASR